MNYPHITWTPITNLSGGIYRPEAYGTPGGTNPAVDMPLIQAAFNAATAASAIGNNTTVRLDKTYAYGYIAGQDLTQSIGPYSISYGIWLNGSNITVDGNNTGKLVCPALPVGMAFPYVGFLIGNGGYSYATQGGYPGWAWLMANDAGKSHIVVKNFVFDNSALTDANLVTLSNGSLSGCLAACHILNSEIYGITIDRGYGVCSGLTLHCSSLRTDVHDCTISKGYRRGFHLDGPEDGEFYNLVYGGMTDANYDHSALGIATNTDYRHAPQNNIVHNCSVTDGGISTGGYNNQIINNTIILPADDAVTRVAISISVNTLILNWPVNNAIVTGNIIQKGGGVARGWGVYLDGVDVSPNDGQPITVTNCNVSGNTFGNLLAIACVLGQQAKNNNFIHNIIYCGQASADVSGGTATGNILTPNP